MRVLVALVFLVGAVFVAGCGGESSESAPAKPSEESSTAKKQAADERAVKAREQEKTAANTEPDTVSGRGSQSLNVGLTPGAASYTYSYQDEGPNKGFFSIELLDSQGKQVALIANNVGSTEGSKTVRIPRADTYFINVTADGGSWTLSGPPVN